MDPTPPTAPHRHPLAAAVLLAAAAAPALPPLAAVAVLVVCAVVWAAMRPPGRDLAVVVLAVAVAVAALLLGGPGAVAGLEDEDWRDATRRSYAAAWDSLDREAEEVAALLAERGLTRDVDNEERRLEAVQALAERVPPGASADVAGRQVLMLVDPDGEPVSWAGEGLLHELRPEDVPAAGRTFEASFGAVTLLSVRPLDDERRPWRAVAARSYPTDRLPFEPSRMSGLLGRGSGSGLRWSLVDAPSRAAASTVVLSPRSATATPALVVAADSLEPPPDPLVPARRIAWTALGVALLLLLAMRGTGLALAGGPGGTLQVAALTLLLTGGSVALAQAAGAEPGALVALALALALAVGGVGLGSRRRHPVAGRGGMVLVAALGGAVVLVLALLAFGLQGGIAAFDPTDRRGSPATLYVLRAALAAAAVGLLALAAGRRRDAGRDPGGEVWGWIALLPALAGAAAVDRPAVALTLLTLAGAALALWLGRRRRSVAVLAVLTVLATVLAAGVWETAHRELLRHELATRVLPRLGPPTADEKAELARRVDRFFSSTELTRFVPRSPEGLGREDLAFLLWQASPLARPRAYSRLSVHPVTPGLPSSFSFGVPVGEAGLVETAPDRWQGRLPVPVEARLVEGTTDLSHRGEPWAVVRWSLLSLPGFRFGGAGRLENVEAALLRGLPGGVAESGLPGAAVFVAYDVTGRPYASPWREEPPLLPELAADRQVVARVATPTGPAWAVSRPTGVAEGSREAGWEALYLPWLTPRAAVERVGLGALDVLLAVLAAALLALLVALPRSAFRAQIRRAVRSYSKRLLLVYTALLLVPLVLLNVVLVAAVENRLRQEQRATGEAALASAQKVVGDYLASVEPGFDLANVLDDELLLWISEVLRHEINLYWGSEVWASSKPELFTARLLPKRIPGESFAGIAFLGYDLAARTNRVGDVSYLELYAPLRVGGEEVEPANFFLSMPLLAQQEEVAGELATLRRQALLVTVVLILLVSAVGVRLSRSFTRPLTELVEGTRRIAAGATSLDLSPSEVELAALVEAVDEMARRIAVGRERLVREKQVVERMVQHITSGVVSLDQDRRVLMRNRVAAELLGLEVGDRLDEALARHRRLAGLVPWVAGADRELEQRTVRLVAAPPPEPGEAVGTGGAGGTADTAPEADGEREWTLVWVPVPGEGEPAALLVVEDVTETLRSQRLEAWAEMARIIAHEIKNPLTPIRLNMEHLQQVWRDRRRPGEEDDRFHRVLERCAANVLTQVEELREIAGEFSTYSRIPKIEPRRGDLGAALEELVEPYRTAPPAGVDVVLETPSVPVHARFDRRLLTRAVRNLVENALRASAGGGRVVLRLERVAGVEPPGTAEARISVLDSGPGIDPALAQRIFDPYFSTYDTGTGLGLPIARRIAEEHGGTIAARNRSRGGLEVAITLPAE